MSLQDGEACMSGGVNGLALSDSVDFGLIGAALGGDVKEAVRSTLAAGAIFPKVGDPISIFRSTLADSIRDIERHPRGQLFRDFFTKGPYVDGGRIPKCERDRYLTDAEVASVTAFIHAYMVNSFKGAVAELLAAGAITRLIKRLQRQAQFPPDARLFVGDSVWVRGLVGTGWRKGADMHILIGGDGRRNAPVVIAGVVEVKSYFKSERRLSEQIDQHISRTKRGLRVYQTVLPAKSVRLGCGPDRRVLRVTVEPGDWTLPRSFRFRKHGENRRLHVTPLVPPRSQDGIEQTGRDDWRITLRWSKEALAEAAYETTFWYMGKVGEVLYADPNVMPKDWSEMTPAEAGRNAAKMMLYYAGLRCRNAREEQRAIALYNAYSFGYALGMNFRNKAGRREMLWPQDLDEIAANGSNKDGSCIG